MCEIKLRMQVLQAARRLSRAAHADHCHWSQGCNNYVCGGGHCRKGSHSVSNARGVTAGKMGRHSSNGNNDIVSASVFRHCSLQRST